MSTQRKPPTFIPPSVPEIDSTKSAAFIFVHGLGDDAIGVEPIARQFQAARKLPYMTWILPNALDNRELMSTAWYLPTRLSPFPPSRPELEDDEDEEGLQTSRAYIESLLDELVAQGIPESRIILGGFSQGHALALLVGLTSSKYAGKLAGLVGLSGYLPLAKAMPRLRAEAGLPLKADDNVSIFLARGTRDMLVPKRHMNICSSTLSTCGVRAASVTVKEYKGMGHVMSGPELRDLCEWLEQVIPPLD